MKDFWAAAVVTGAVIAGTTAFGIAGQSAQVFGPSVYKGASRRRSVALTFDDGPSEGTLLLLDLLDKYNAKATFFQCGMNVERHPKIAGRVQQAGHQLGNHTYSHPRLCPRFSRQPNVHSPGFILDQLQRTQGIIQEATTVRPTLVRAPYGLRWYGLDAAQQQLSLMGVMWTVIGHDWEWPADAVAEIVLSKVAPGGIVCLHDGRGHSGPSRHIGNDDGRQNDSARADRPRLPLRDGKRTASVLTAGQRQRPKAAQTYRINLDK